MKTVTVLSIGVVGIENGNTQYDWGIYDDFWLNKMYAWLTTSGFLVFSSNKDDFEIGETVVLRNNDSNRKIKTCEIKDVSIVNYDDLLKMLKSHQFDYSPIAPFRSRPKGNRKLTTSYSVKGISF